MIKKKQLIGSYVANLLAQWNNNFNDFIFKGILGIFKSKKKVLVVSADVYRPAAIEQLKILAEQVEVDFFPSSISDKPEKIVAEVSREAEAYLEGDKDRKEGDEHRLEVGIPHAGQRRESPAQYSSDEPCRGDKTE